MANSWASLITFFLKYQAFSCQRQFTFRSLSPFNLFMNGVCTESNFPVHWVVSGAVMPSRPCGGPPTLQEERCLGPVAHHALILDNSFSAVSLVFWPWLRRIHFLAALPCFSLSIPPSLCPPLSGAPPDWSATFSTFSVKCVVCEMVNMANSQVIILKFLSCRARRGKWHPWL